MSLLNPTFYSDPYGANDLEYEVGLSAFGEGTLRESDLLDMQKPDAILQAFRAKHRRYPRTISLRIEDSFASGYDFGYTGIDTGLLEKLETLKELILPDSITQIDVTPKLETILRKNKTLIRGTFDSFAERFASEHGLHFRPADFVFAESFFAPAHESTQLTLQFKRNGSVQIREAVSAPGSSASHTSGGSFTHALHKNFCTEQTAGQIAGMFRDRLRDAILEDGRLAAFLEKAKTHAYFQGKN